MQILNPLSSFFPALGVQYSSRIVSLICCVVVALTSVISATAQEPFDIGMATAQEPFDIGTATTQEPFDVVTAAAADDSWDSVVALASADDEMVGSSYPTDISDLRTQISQLDSQIAQLQTQKRIPVSWSATAEPPKLFVAFESVLVQPTQSNKTGVIVETDEGYSHVMFPWQVEHSPRVSFGYDSGNEDLGWRVRYWQFRHTESFTAGPDNGVIPVGYEGVVGYLSEDGDVTTGLAFIEEGEFWSHVRTDVVDLELQRRLTSSVNLYAGLRYGKVKQGYTAKTDRGDAYARSQFRGIGPTLALQFEHRLPLERLVLFTNVRGSLLMGRQNFNVYDDVNGLQQSLNEIDLTSMEEGVNSLATNGEMQLGIRYDVAKWLSFTVALEAQHFGNVGGANPTAVFAGPDSGLAGDSPLDDNLSMIGLNVGTQLNY